MGPPLDTCRHERLDITKPHVFRALRRWIVQGRLWYIHFAITCKPWSQATSDHSSDKHSADLRLYRVVLKLLKLCRRYRVHWSIEKPMYSRLWCDKQFSSFLDTVVHHTINYDNCSFGNSYKKPSRIITTLTSLSRLNCRCTGGHAHERLQGVIVPSAGPLAGQRVWKTRLAAQYPYRLCIAWAQALRLGAPNFAFRQYGNLNALGWEVELAVKSEQRAVNVFQPTALPYSFSPWSRSDKQWGQLFGPHWKATCGSPPGL